MCSDLSMHAAHSLHNSFALVNAMAVQDVFCRQKFSNEVSRNESKFLYHQRHLEFTRNLFGISEHYGWTDIFCPTTDLILLSGSIQILSNKIFAAAKFMKSLKVNA